MSTPAFEAFLARLYTDAPLRARVLADPRGAAREAGLTPADGEALARIDREGLALAAEMFLHKRALKGLGGRGAHGPDAVG